MTHDLIAQLANYSVPRKPLPPIQPLATYSGLPCIYNCFTISKLSSHAAPHAGKSSSAPSALLKIYEKLKAYFNRDFIRAFYDRSPHIRNHEEQPHYSLNYPATLSIGFSNDATIRPPRPRKEVYFLNEGVTYSLTFFI